MNFLAETLWKCYYLSKSIPRDDEDNLLYMQEKV